MGYRNIRLLNLFFISLLLFIYNFELFQTSRTGERALRAKLPGICGSSLLSSNRFQNLAKIVGGSTREQRDSPWLVSLQLRESVSILVEYISFKFINLSNYFKNC